MRQSSPPHTLRQKRRACLLGFTLLEMLVVLTLIALIAGIALPNLSRMLASFTASTKWSALLNEVDGLSYRAYAAGQPIRLSASSAPQHLSSLPSGWKIVVETNAKTRGNSAFGLATSNANDTGSAISYRENGWCDGGRITFITDEGTQRTIDLVAPRCSVSAS